MITPKRKEKCFLVIDDCPEPVKFRHIETGFCLCEKHRDEWCKTLSSACSIKIERFLKMWQPVDSE